MPRSYRSCGSGSRGRVYSSASSGSDNTKNVAALVGLSRLKKNWESILLADPGRCQILFDFYEECMSENGTNASTCDYIREEMASCDGVKRDPRHQSVVQRRKEDVESLQQKATAAGFAGLEEYLSHKRETDPQTCRVAYEKYNECLGENRMDCDGYKGLLNKCPQFEKVSK